MKRFNKAMAKGDVPRPHRKRGSLNQWNYARLVREYESGIWEGHGDDPPAQKKKPEPRANAIQAKATSKPSKESQGSATLPHRKNPVNGIDDAVSHDG
jgi:hypothetical protein